MNDRWMMGVGELSRPESGRPERPGPAGSRRGWAAAALVAVAIFQAMPAAQAQTPAVPRKLEREMAIMERVVDQMLLDSRNFLVASARGSTHGLYLEGYGALFAFEASLLNRETGKLFDWEDFEIKDDGDVIVIKPKDRKKTGDDRRGKQDPDEDADDDRDPDEDRDPAGDEGVVIRKSWRDRNRDREERLYNLGKEEIKDLLLDYGDSMSSLGDTEWLAMAAFLKNDLPFLDDDVNRLVIKARMSDLRAFGAGRITREVMLKKVVIEEY